MQIINEHYHVYNRGAHKEKIFIEKEDYDRFLIILYSCNDLKPLAIHKMPFSEYFRHERNTIVSIRSYCIMPNHFHLLLYEKTNAGISIFLRKLCTAYAMYFNKKYKHSGTIIQGKYKSKIVSDDDYYRYLIQYIHLNPYGLETPDMTKEARREYPREAFEVSGKYEYSSMKEFLGEQRIQISILDLTP